LRPLSHVFSARVRECNTNFSRFAKANLTSFFGLKLLVIFLLIGGD
jgi:hypothetical protein